MHQQQRPDNTVYYALKIRDETHLRRIKKCKEGVEMRMLPVKEFPGENRAEIVRRSKNEVFVVCIHEKRDAVMITSLSRDPRKVLGDSAVGRNAYKILMDDTDRKKPVISTRQEIELRQCALCKKDAPANSMCSGCKQVRYCSPECQSEHWCAHKIVCQHIASVRSGEKKG